MLAAGAVVLLIFLSGGLAARPLLPPQPQAVAPNLDAGISQIRAGDFISALVTLNDVATELSARPDLATTLARARAYQALAYTLLDQPDRARAFAALALSADPRIAVNAPEFTPALIALFGELRRPTTQEPEAEGDAANRGGGLQEALLAYLRAFQALPEPPEVAADQRLREKIVRVVQQLATKPVVSERARSHYTKAQDLLDAEAILGGVAGTASQQAAAELRQAIRLAPWWADAIYRLATVQQRLNLVDEALVNLGLYRLADPEGYAARAARAVPRDVAAVPPAAPPVVPKPAGPALIYIYWPEQQRGGGRQKIFCNGQQVAELQNNRFVVLRAAAGTHDLAFRNKHVAAVVEAGREYHFRTSIEGHWQFAMGPEIRPVAPEAAKAEMSQQEMKVNDARRTRSAECGVPPAARGRRD